MTSNVSAVALAAVGAACHASPDAPPGNADLGERPGEAGSALATCVTLQRSQPAGGPVADAMIVAAQGATNFGGNAALQTGGSGNDRWRSLVRFDLRKAPKPGTQVYVRIRVVCTH